MLDKLIWEIVREMSVQLFAQVTLKNLVQALGSSGYRLKDHVEEETQNPGNLRGELNFWHTTFQNFEPKFLASTDRLL